MSIPTQKLTRQQAIDAKCRDCIYDSESGLGTWKAQTEGCTSQDCPLYPYRPITSTTKKRLQEERLAVMTTEELRSYRVRQESARMRLSAGKKQQGTHFGEVE